VKTFNAEVMPNTVLLFTITHFDPGSKKQTCASNSSLLSGIPRKSKCGLLKEAESCSPSAIKQWGGTHARSVEHIKHCAARAARNAFRAAGQVSEPRRFNDGGGPLGVGWEEAQWYRRPSTRAHSSSLWECWREREQQPPTPPNVYCRSLVCARVK
jgi:hypothetical protein